MVVDLPGAGWTAKQNETARQAREIFDRWRKMQLAQGWNFCRQRANRRGGAGTFAMQVDTEAAQPLDAIRGIGDAAFTKEIQGVLREGRNDRSLDVRAIENGVFDFANFAVLANTGRSAFDEQ
jgi:hypothetical protein